jgi:hypothetical protein
MIKCFFVYHSTEYKEKESVDIDDGDIVICYWHQCKHCQQITTGVYYY